MSYVYVISDFIKSPSNNTINIGPIEHNATKPKLSFLDFFRALAEEKPIPIASINGTDIGPVVTPPESNATGIISFDEMHIITNNNA